LTKRTRLPETASGWLRRGSGAEGDFVGLAYRRNFRRFGQDRPPRNLAAASPFRRSDA
jgi:hypothetical protein